MSHLHTCEYCHTTYNTVAYWHCPSDYCCHRREAERQAAIDRIKENVQKQLQSETTVTVSGKHALYAAIAAAVQLVKDDPSRGESGAIVCIQVMDANGRQIASSSCQL